MSYQPCHFNPFSLPDYIPMPAGYELTLPVKARVPNPFVFDRGTAQFAPATTSWPINMPKVKPNPPTTLSFSKIQDPWHQFGLKWQAPCNVWSQHEVPPAQNPQDYGDAGLWDKWSGLTNAQRIGIGVASVGAAMLGLWAVHQRRTRG